MNALHPKSLGQIRAGILSGLDDTVRDFGKGVSDILRGLNSEYPVRSVSSDFISLEQYTSKMELAARKANSQNFGLVFGSRFDIRQIGPLGYILTLSPTIGEALEFFTSHIAHAQSNTKMTLESSGGISRVTYSVQDEKSYMCAQDAEASIAIMHSFLNRYGGKGFKSKKVSFEHMRPFDDSLKGYILGVLPSYEADTNAIYFDTTLLNKRLPNHEPVLYDMLKQTIVSEIKDLDINSHFLHEAQDYIKHAIHAYQDVSLSELAANFGFSNRTLQDRFSLLGVSFRELKTHETMLFAAKLIAETKQPLTEIALDLGFSESSSFSRAFKKHHGKSPREYRMTSMF